MNATEVLDAVIDTTSIMSAVSSFSDSTLGEEKEGPPSVIHIPVSPLERKEAFYFASSSNPYAQLCYDPQQKTLMAIMETRRKGQRDILPDSFPPLQTTNTDDTTSSSSSSQLSNASTFTLSTMTEKRVDRHERYLPFVLGTEHNSNRHNENCLYLLEDYDVEMAPNKTGPGCARALQKFVKSRPLRFLQVHKHQYPRQPLRERIVKHGYEPIQSQRSVQKWV